MMAGLKGGGATVDTGGHWAGVPVVVIEEVVFFDDDCYCPSMPGYRECEVCELRATAEKAEA